MAITQLAPPYPIFTDRDGSPLDAGYLYFGEANLNPETNPIQVYYDNAFTQPAAQPIRTINGYPSRNGSPAAIYANDYFSVTVRNKRNELVIYSPSGYGITPGSSASFASQLTILDAGNYYTSSNVEDALQELGGTKNPENVTVLLADTDLTYSAGLPESVSAGDIIRTRVEGFAYKVAASAATDHHVTTAGGVKLYVLPLADGYFQGEAFGAVNGVLSTSAIQTAIQVAAGKKLVFGPGVWMFASTLSIPANTTLAGAGASTIFEPVGDIDGINVPARHVTLENFRIRGTAASTSARACLTLGVNGTDCPRSRIKNLIVGGRGGTPAPLEPALTLAGDAIRGDLVFLVEFSGVYAYKARYGFDVCKANGAISGLQNANHFSACEFQDCVVGYRAGRLKACTFSACTFAGNDQHGLILGFINGCSLDGVYFESNHSLNTASIKADLLIDPAAVGETDPGGGVSIKGWFTKGANSTHGIYIVKQRGFDISSTHVNSGYATAAVYIGSDVTNQGTVGRACHLPSGIINDAPGAVVTYRDGRSYNYEDQSVVGIAAAASFDLFSPNNGDIWDVWITRNTASATIYWMGVVMKTAAGTLVIVPHGSSNITVTDNAGTISATNGTGSTQNYLWGATRRVNL
jgi:hypothetical protein